MKCRLYVEVDPEDLVLARRRGKRWPGDVLAKLRAEIRELPPGRARDIRVMEDPTELGNSRRFLLCWRGTPIESAGEAARRTT